jgi:hypothetical protein
MTLALASRNQLPFTEIGKTLGQCRENTGELYLPFCGRVSRCVGHKKQVGKLSIAKAGPSVCTTAKDKK